MREVFEGASIDKIYNSRNIKKKKEDLHLSMDLDRHSVFVTRDCSNIDLR